MSEDYRTSSRPYHGPAFFSVEETCTVSEGDGRRFVRHVVRHPGGSAVVALIGRSALCVQQYRPAIEQVTLELPAGRPDGAESAIETARRELREETGLRAVRLAPLTQFFNAPCFCDGLTEVFVTDDFEQGGTEPGQDFPTNVRLVGLDDVESLVRVGSLVDAKTILGLLLARSWVDGS
ncbi:NUDIX hydrolase [Micromonospora parva]|uniref:NUDIX hydrolase n=1 Tax=Micromonospora parva TaxID=1464048 RepID=UPI003670B143